MPSGTGFVTVKWTSWIQMIEARVLGNICKAINHAAANNPDHTTPHRTTQPAHKPQVPQQCLSQSVNASTHPITERRRHCRQWIDHLEWYRGFWLRCSIIDVCSRRRWLCMLWLGRKQWRKQGMMCIVYYQELRLRACAFLCIPDFCKQLIEKPDDHNSKF
jgi:hypothetical protein